jgi:outer membrane receptor protein involved in Fe transport
VSAHAAYPQDAKPAPDARPLIPEIHESIVIHGAAPEPAYDRRNGEVFNKALFGRDDQIFHLLDAGINAGQHEGGGKSVEIRRFGFNLDHGGVNGGLKVLVDNIQQNQGTQGHGQGYLGALKGLSPELIEDVSVINGPFSPEYGDFSGLGVVHIRLRESLPDKLTLRMQGGSFNTARGFAAFSPELRNADMVVAYEGAFTDGPFLKPLDYRRDNITGNFTWRKRDHERFSVRWSGAKNDFSSSGQIHLDEVAAGRLDRFGALGPGDGGRYRAGTGAFYYRREGAKGQVWKADGFVSRSLFDLYSNFTFFLNDPVNGDGIQQHDSRLQQGANLQYLRPFSNGNGLFTAGANLHANQINVGLYPRIDRTPIGVSTRANANVTNGAGYAQGDYSLFQGRLQASAGLRWDLFRFDVADRVEPELTGASNSTSFQPKAALAYRPFRFQPFTIHFNYGRGISSLDARGVVRSPGDRRLAATDFTQASASWQMRRWSAVASYFFINRSNELVYIPDDGSLEFLGPSRAYGFEAKSSFELTRSISFNGGITKVLNAYYRDTQPREYVDRAPRFTANAALTVSSWRGWSGSLRMRAINGYRLDTLDPFIRAAGHTVFDAFVSRRIARGLELSFAAENLANRAYWETQNWFESRLAGQDPATRIHATPGYSRTLTVGLTARFGGK